MVTTGFTLGDGRLEVRVSADAVDPADPDTDSFAWQVLTTTADRVTAETTADSITVSLTVVSATAGSRS